MKKHRCMTTKTDDDTASTTKPVAPANTKIQNAPASTFPVNAETVDSEAAVTLSANLDTTRIIILDTARTLQESLSRIATVVMTGIQLAEII